MPGQERRWHNVPRNCWTMYVTPSASRTIRGIRKRRLSPGSIGSWRELTVRFLVTNVETPKYRWADCPGPATADVSTSCGRRGLTWTRRPRAGYGEVGGLSDLALASRSWVVIPR